MMQPPWITHPDIPAGSVGWRMGRGEEAYDRFYQWFSDQSERQRAEVMAANPEPAGWEGFYGAIAAAPWARSEG